MPTTFQAPVIQRALVRIKEGGQVVKTGYCYVGTLNGKNIVKYGNLWYQYTTQDVDGVYYADIIGGPVAL